MDEPLTILHNDDRTICICRQRAQDLLATPARKLAQRYTNTPNSFALATACVRRSTPSLLLI
ncbi:hypothetical protein D3C80_1301640 [compost metagenome]|jgi:hypothetical protein